MRGSEERSDKLPTLKFSVENESHGGSYFRTRRATSVITAIIRVPNPNPFRNSLRSSQPPSLFLEVRCVSRARIRACVEALEEKGGAGEGWMVGVVEEGE